MSVGTISVAVNDQPARKVNIHSSGAPANSVLNAIVDLKIPARATVTVSLAADDVGVSIENITVGDGNLDLPPDIWNLPPLPVAPGPWSADWHALGRSYTVPDWWREAKFGAWSHWDPQSMPEDGDWYARNMYIQGSPQYQFQLSHFGHPSVYGYKDICHNWVIDRWSPEDLMDLYIEMGARYFMAMGCHHDNFDCFDSQYQPWNSVRVGPKVDIVGTWEKIARRRGMRFGIGFHDTPPRTWGQFMPVRYTSDKTGPMKGVP
ncbi:MAG TPA: alpha-L-fucosidase, partial [Acidobacteriaceae bacterium]